MSLNVSSDLTAEAAQDISNYIALGFLTKKNKSKWFDGIIVIDFRSEGRNHYSVECVPCTWLCNVSFFMECISA